MGIGQCEQAPGKGLEPGFIHFRQGQRQRKRQWRSAAGCQITQIHGQRFVPQTKRVNCGQEMAALHQHVARDGELGAGARLQERTVIAHPHNGTARRVLEVARNEVKLTELAHGG